MSDFFNGEDNDDVEEVDIETKIRFEQSTLLSKTVYCHLNTRLKDIDPFLELVAHYLVNTQENDFLVWQYELGIPFLRAGRIKSQLQDAGVLGEYSIENGTPVLVKDISVLQEMLKEYEERADYAPVSLRRRY